MSEFVIRDGYLWPAEDEHCYKAAMLQVKDLHVAMQYCKKKDVAIQAGGNCGIWPKELSKHFKWVYTFEPQGDNFHCLTRNAPEKNIIKMQAALGMVDRKPIALMGEGINAGAYYVSPEHDGVIPQISIDSLNLPGCDLIQLDIEGYEFHAVMGAECTIREYSPVIMLESKGHGERYSIGKNDLTEYLQSLGYKLKGKISKDIILVKE